MMTKYRWTGVKNHQIIRGAQSATSVSNLKQQLNSQGIALIDHQLSPVIRWRAPLKRKSKSVSALRCIQQMLPLITQGVHLTDSIDILCQTARPDELGFWTALQHDIQSGVPLSHSLQQRNQFSPFIIALVTLGENTGQLGFILEQCEHFLSNQANLKKDIRKALRYPAIVLTVTLLITLFLLLQVLPQFQQTFLTLNATLPTLTQNLMNTADFLQQHGAMMLGGLSTLIIIGSAVWRQVPQCKTKALICLGRLPIIKGVQTEMARFQLICLLSLSLQAKLPINKALQLSIPSFSNPAIGRLLQTAWHDIEAGTPFAQALANVPLLSKTQLSLLQISEAGGHLERTVSQMAQEQQQQLHNKIHTIKQLLEPVFMVCLSAIVGSIVVAMYLPIFQLGTAI